MKEARVKFVWVGHDPAELGGEYGKRLCEEVKAWGLEGDVEFTGYLANPYPAYQAFDVFVLSSREDPFPLVCLDNLYLGKPVVCFAEGGGAAEVVRGDAGIVVENLDPSAMARAVVRLLRDKEERDKLGRRGRERIREEFSIPRLAESVHEILEGLPHQVLGSFFHRRVASRMPRR